MVGKRVKNLPQVPRDAGARQFIEDPAYKRADLHCHSRYSVFKYFRRANTRDCYNKPEEVYRTAKERGMAYVTLTDHDSIDGCLYLLNKYPDLTDFFISEEIETRFPETRQRVHIGAYNITEAQHREVQKLRDNIRELVPYMKSENMLFGVNHLLQSYRMRNIAARYIRELIEMFDIFEVLNGAMASFHNRVVHQLLTIVGKRGRKIAMVGGSDAHTLKHVGKVYTVSKAESVPEFLDNVRYGNCFAWGEEMRFRDLVADIYLLAIAYLGEHQQDFPSDQYTGSEKTIQLMNRLAAVPAFMSGLPAAIVSLNYLKQIFVSKGIELRFERLIAEMGIELEDEERGASSGE
jgi:predicted metal-dependent phosphoesterase TrpH